MKKLLVFVVLLVVLVLGALIALPLFIDPNDHKDTIVEQVKKHTDRDLSIVGDLKMSKFPSLGVDIGEIELSNAPGFSDQPMLKSGQASVSIKIMPILKAIPGFITDKEKAMTTIMDDIEISTLVLKDVFLNLERDQSGKTNLDDLAGEAKPEEKEANESKLNLAALAIGGIDMQNVNLTWDDRQAGKKYSANKLFLKTGRLQLNKPVELKLSLEVDAADEGIAGPLSLEGTIEYDLEKKKYSVSPLDFHAALTGSGVPGGQADLKLKAKSALFDMGAALASVKDLDLDALGTKVSGNLEASNIFDQLPLASGNLKINAQSIASLLTALGKDPTQIPLSKLIADAKFSSHEDSMKIDHLSALATVHGGTFKDPEDVMLDIKGEFNLAKQTAYLSKLSFEGLGTTVQGKIQAKNILAAIPLLDGQLIINASNVASLLEALGQDASAMPVKSLTADTKLTSSADSMKLENMNAKLILAGDQIPNSPVNVALNTTADVNLTEQTLNVQSFTIKGMGLDLQGAVHGTKIIDKPDINGNLKIAPFNLRQLMAQLNLDPPITANADVFSHFSFNSDFAATKNSLSLKGLAMQLDKSNLNGELSVINFSNPAPRFNITIDAINLDHYLPPKAPAATQAAASSPTMATTTASSEGLPMDSLRKLNAQGSLNIGSLIVSNAKLKNVKLGLNAKAGKITLQPASANLYQGSYNGAVNLDATGSQPVFNVTSQLNGLQVAPLLTDLTGKAKIDGTVVGSIQINAHGADANSIKKSLNGNTDLKFENGALLGVNLAKILRDAKATLTGQKAVAETGQVKTDFSQLSATTVIKNGLISNQDFLMKSPFLRVTGNGTANLGSEAVDYNVIAAVVGSGKGQGGEDLSELKGIDIPVKVSGTFSDLKYGPDFAGLAKAKAKKEIEKHKDKVIGKATEKLQEVIPTDKLDKILPGGLDALLGGEKAAETGAGAEAAAPAPAKEAAPAKNVEDQVKDKIKGLLKF